MDSLVRLNPYFRSSAREIIKNKLFDDIRIPNNEKQNDNKIKLNID